LSYLNQFQWFSSLKLCNLVLKLFSHVFKFSKKN
jgi:hypothetical protein